MCGGSPTPKMEDEIKMTNKLSVEDYGVGVSFEGLTYSVNTGKKEDPPLMILEQINGSFVPGKLTALMGASGSGKTSLLDVLAGRKTAGTLNGQVLFNGMPPTIYDFRYTVGYVEQFDTLVGELTVENMLRYTAELKLPSSVAKEEREARVNDVIRTLDLESCRNNVIGNQLQRGISGGQAKRVNIGLALLQKPPILLADEPTSGLDSRVADEVILLLQNLARSGKRTVVCTIHSPTGHAFSCFDELYMIHRGKTIYDGSVENVQAYFENSGYKRDVEASLPEWLVDLTSDLESLQQRKSSHASAATSVTRSFSFVELFESSAMKKDADVTRQDLIHSWKTKTGSGGLSHSLHGNTPSEFNKLITLLKYRMVAHYMDVEFVGTRFGDKIVYALLILSLYFGLGEERDPQSITSISSLLFFISAICGFGAAAFVPTLTQERKLFYRELADGCYSPATYYFSKFIEEAVIAVFTSALFTVVVFFGLKLTGNFGIFFSNYYLTTLIGVILAYLFSAAVPSLEAANALLPTYVTICLYFGGLFIVFDKIPKGWEWFSWTSFMRYSWGAFMVDNYSNTDLATLPVFFDSDGNPKTVLQFYGMSEGPIMNSTAACLGLLSLLLLTFSILGVLALVYIRHEKR